MHQVLPGSFRDPSGFLFEEDGKLYRQINPGYAKHYEALLASGLYAALVGKGLLVPHTEVESSVANGWSPYRVVQPELVPFISYPYEWCFSHFRDAALTTLQLQRLALQHGLTLKDASAYNIQFHHGGHVLIDTLSFEVYQEGAPWVAYRQFCQHFLAPLALMSRADVRLGKLGQLFIDGIPLDLASSLLPLRTRFAFGLLTHIHMHARAQHWYSARERAAPPRRMSRTALLALIDNLESLLEKLRWQPHTSEWSNYYDATNYTSESMQLKQELVAAYLEAIRPNTVWDLGGNTGVFSRIASNRGISTICFDIDPIAVEKNYRTVVHEREQNLVPLVLDLTNPTAAIGWSNRERMSLAERGPADAALALALVHHLAISNNVPLGRIAEFFSDLARSLVIEFVPKSDSQVQRLLRTRPDIFPEYSVEGFERAFSRYFRIERRDAIPGSGRCLYVMQRQS
jgi:ribosomal protein L11 methylase PrmA